MINKYFLAKMNISAYLKKFLYNRYYGYIIEGIPPITFQGNGKYLLDYRIYGASGGVGDKTNNLFDGTFLHRSVIGNEVGTDDVNRRSIAIDISNYNNGEKITFSRETALGSVFQMYQVSSTQTGGKLCNESVVSGNSNTRLATITITNVNEYPYLMIFLNGANNPIKDEELIASKIMINVGNTALPYEPYGYKVPVVVNGKNLLDEANAVVTDYYLTNNGQEAVGANGDKFLKSHIYVNPSTQYTFKWSQIIMGSANNTPYIRISEYTSNNTFIQRLLCQCSAQSQNTFTFTTSNNTLYIDIRIDSETSTRGQHITEVMLVKGATAPDTYEEYTATTTNIYLDKPIEGKANIPSEYTEVEYIESTRTQYINTGFKLNTNCRIVFDYYLTTLVSFSPFGSFQNQNSIGFTAYTTDNTSRFGTFSTKNLTGNYNQYQINNRTHFEYSKNGLYQNGSLVYSITTNDAVSNYNCFIFARNANDVATGLGNIRMYYFKIYDNDSLVFDGVPCYRKSDNVAGLYDLVNNTFYTNQGTGNFIVGPIKENESISLSDTNVNIPTIRGTNVLTVDTTVQPSKVLIKVGG